MRQIVLVAVLQPYRAKHARDISLVDCWPQSAASRQSFFLDAFQTEARRQMEAAAAMPLTVQRAGATLQALEDGDVKLRVRVMESERADRRQGVMQARGKAPLLRAGTCFRT